ncbi:queuosine salvage family protein [Naumannella halotolerans]|uniref:queuosine salvage family protein n=1 Tax=Naumannella halotolerans TaxID=993414 RepID=UPI00370D5406
MPTRSEPGPDLLARVRDECAAATQQARHVRIDPEALADYTDRLEPGAEAVPVFDAEHHYRGDPSSTLLAVLCLDAVNFGSGWFPRFRKRPGRSGYLTVAESLRDWFVQNPPTAAELAGVEVDRVGAIFGQSGNPQVADLMQLFGTALNQLGSLLVSDFSGDPELLVRAADGQAGRLVQVLVQMPMFDDVATVDGRRVSFFKRAQLTAVDLALALPDHELGHFDDLDRLTIFADNLVPHVLHTDGVLEYDAELTEQIASGQLLPAGSRAEVELRAVAIHACELMVDRLGGRATAADLDYLLWNRGADQRYRDRPRHRTETWFY